MWDLADQHVGDRQTYTSHNEKGNKRQKYKYFQEVKPGDFVVGYPTVDIPLSATYMDRGHKISIRTINLNQPWQGIHQDLLALVA